MRRRKRLFGIAHGNAGIAAFGRNHLRSGTLEAQGLRREHNISQYICQRPSVRFRRRIDAAQVEVMVLRMPQAARCVVLHTRRTHESSTVEFYGTNQAIEPIPNG